jgi:hypothetical protein
MMRLVLPLVLIVGLAACGDDDPAVDPEGVAAFTFRERMLHVDDAVVVWEVGETLAEAHAGAEAAANGIVGPNGPGYGDRDGNGTIDGEEDFGVLQGLDGTPVGLADSLDETECVVADVLGGSWNDPGARWAELTAAVDAWSTDNNTVQSLDSQPMRLVAWAELALASDSLDEVREFAGRAQLHIDVSLDALDC